MSVFRPIYLVLLLIVSSAVELDWHIVDEEFNGYANDLLSKVDAILFGRVTYQLMADYWPSPSATRDDPIIVDKMYNLPKLFFQKRCKRLNGTIQGWLKKILRKKSRK
jgi:dihydrofolate reductase